MVTRIRQGNKRPPVLFTEVWMDRAGISFEELGLRLDPPKSRTTVWRWIKEPWRLDPEKMAEIAAALGITPQDLWRHPDRPSIDAEVKDLSVEEHMRALDMIRVFTRKVS